MSVIVGVVSNGVVVPETPLPEGTRVEIHYQSPAAILDDLQEEFDAWERTGAGTIEMTESLAEELDANEKG